MDENEKTDTLLESVSETSEEKTVEKVKQPNKMGVMPIPKLVIIMALPLMLSLLVQSLYNIVDGIFVGKISEEAFSATSLAYPVQLLMIAVSVGTGVGVNAVCSRMVGAKKLGDASNAATTGLIVSLIGTGVFMLFGATLVPVYTKLCSGSEGTLKMCESYLRICTIGCLGVFMETLGQRLLQATGKTLLSMVSLVVGAVTNLVLDPLFIFVFNMGIEGAAVATVIGQWVGAGIALTFHFVLNKEIKIAFKGFKFRKDIVWSIFKVGLPTMLTQAMGSIMLFSMNAVLGALLPGINENGIANSIPAIAFFGGYYKLQNFLYMPIMGLGQAAIPIVGFNFGAKNPDRIKQVVKVSVPIAAGFALLGTILFEAIPGQLLGIFSASEDALRIGRVGLRIIAATFVFGSVTTVLGYTCSGLGNGLVNMIGTALRQALPLIPLAYLFGKIGGVDSIWYSLWVSEILATAYAVFFTLREFKKKISKIEKSEQIKENPIEISEENLKLKEEV